MSTQYEAYEPNINKVIEKEREYVSSRRSKIADEFVRIFKTKKDHWYSKLLRKSARPAVGMAFSGGGIRSATFNLGVVQALSKFGVLPWVDYLSSVSGGGYIASCMTSLLAYEEKKLSLNEKDPDSARYYPFSSHWKRFPFNPDLQVFDKTGVAYELPIFNENTLNSKFKPHNEEETKLIQTLQGDKLENIDLELKASADVNRNRQLEHMRKMGSYLIPRAGPFTLDTLRGIVGAVILRIGYTLWTYLLAMFIIGVSHYAIVFAFTPEIAGNFNLEKSVSQQAAPAVEAPNAEAEEKPPAPTMFDFALVSYRNGQTFAPGADYWLIFFNGLFYAFIIVPLISFGYRKDATTENRLMDWKPPSKYVSLYSYLVIQGIRWAVALLALTLAGLSARLLFKQLQMPDLIESQTTLLKVVNLLFLVYLGALIYFIGWYAKDEAWAQNGLPENEFIDKLVSVAFVLITLWNITLVVSALRFFNLDSNVGLNLYWLWTPCIFIIGNMMGLALLQATQVLQKLWPLKYLFTKRVFFKEGKEYDDKAIGGALRFWFKFIGITDNRKFPDRSKIGRKSRGVDYVFTIWSNPEFRAIFWTLQGILFYGLIGFLTLGLIALPNFFAGTSATDPTAIIPLSATLISAAWAYLKSSGKSEKIGEWVSKVFSLPEEISHSLLSLLVIALNFSILFMIESAIDGWFATPPSAAYMGWLIALALGLFGLTGLLVNANYLSAHYFYRDRLGEAYFQTSVDDHESRHIRIVRDDRDRRMSRMLRPRCSAPYHIVLTTLNMSGSWHLEYKDRKSQPFIFSKEYSGSNITGYVKTGEYRNDNTKYSQAIALSGAAVSSGLGFLTFFAQAFLVTLFNLRLGLWITNPKLYKDEKSAKSAKRAEEFNFWASYLWNEARGRMSERDNLVNITDGAHTDDNIGLYPLFQRRCKFIIAGDAGEDPKGTCSSLFSVIKQAEVDLGIKVEINVDGLAPDEYDAEKKTASKSKKHFAIGKIHYPKQNADDDEEDTRGWLIYLRPSVVEGDPAPIGKYWERHKLDFPHPTTADQFFNDEQFEIMRLLGEWTVENALMEIKKKFADKLADENKEWVGDAKAISKINRSLEFINAWIDFNAEQPFKVPASFQRKYDIAKLLEAYCEP
ncbi:MAG: hypothetical protein PHQ36_01050 [Anaerolineales bacterium]|nr:hypothetical protein [Anaerolineales bacterium]